MIPFMSALLIVTSVLITIFQPFNKMESVIKTETQESVRLVNFQQQQVQAMLAETLVFKQQANRLQDKLEGQLTLAKAHKLKNMYDTESTKKAFFENSIAYNTSNSSQMLQLINKLATASGVEQSQATY